MEKFIDICKKVNDSDALEISKIVEEWKLDNLSDKECSKLIEECKKSYKNIDINKMPFFLDALYKSDLKLKTKLFCVILEGVHQDIPFITNIEDVYINIEKYKYMLPTLVRVTSNNLSGISDCINLIMLNNDSEGKYLTKEDRNMLLDSMEKKFLVFLQFATFNEVDEEIDSSIEILSDLACFINNHNILMTLYKFLDVNISNISKIYIIKTLLFNNIDVDDSYILSIASKRGNASKLYAVLESINREQFFPEKYRNQEYLACSNMCTYLSLPTTLGEDVEEISFVDILEEDEYIYYIYKFKSMNELYKDNGYMIGISGGFDSSRITATSNGRTFSNFLSIEDDYLKQAKEMLDKFNKVWGVDLEN